MTRNAPEGILAKLGLDHMSNVNQGIRPDEGLVRDRIKALEIESYFMVPPHGQASKSTTRHGMSYPQEREIGHSSREKEAEMATAGMSREELDAKIAASDARADAKFAEMLRHSDTKFAELMGKLETSTAVGAERFTAMQSELHSVRTATEGARTTYIVTAIASTLAIAGLVIGLLAYGGQMLSNGASTADIARREAEAVATRSNAATEAAMRKVLEDVLKSTRPAAQDQKPRAPE